MSERLVTTRVLLAAAIAAMLVYASPLAPLWYDEVYTLGVFLPQGPAGFLADYHLPNNHLFYTLLLWAWQGVVGDDRLLLRALGLALTTLALPALFVAGRAIAGERAGALAALVLGSSQVVGSFSAQLRGYGLSIALVAIVLAAAALWWRSGLRNPHALVVYTLAGALAIWTVPTNIAFVAAGALWVVLCARAWKGPAERVRSLALALPLLGLLGYAAVWRQMLAWTGSPIWRSWDEFIGVFAHDVLLGDLPWLLPVAALLAFHDRRRLAVLGPAWALLAVTAFTLLLPLLGPVPWPRNYVPLLPLLALAGGLLLDRAATLARGGVVTVVGALLLVLLLRPLLQPETDPHAASTQVPEPGELLAPYYLDRGFDPQRALQTLFDEREPAPSLLLMGNTTHLELESSLLALADRHRVCQLLFDRDGNRLQTSCLPPPRADMAVDRLVVIASSREQAERLRRALGETFAAAMDGPPLAPMQDNQGIHGLWAARLR